MKLFLDTNVFLRYFLRDNEDQFQSCLNLFEYIEQGMIHPYTSSIVFLEVQYVLEKVYEVDKVTVGDKINMILQTRKLGIIERTDFKSAWKLHAQKRIKLSDCLIATQIPKGVILCTFDQELLKLSAISTATPDTVIKRLKKN